MGYMTPISVTQMAESADDRMQQALDDAVLAAADAREEATDSMTFPEVLDGMGMHFDNRDRATFMKALERGDKQDITMMIWRIQKEYDELVEKKARAILEATQ